MVVICDVKEYRNCIDKFKIPLLDNIFNILHALCNLLIVEPANLQQVSSGDQLVCLVALICQYQRYYFYLFSFFKHTGCFDRSDDYKQFHQTSS